MKFQKLSTPVLTAPSSGSRAPDTPSRHPRVTTVPTAGTIHEVSLVYGLSMSLRLCTFCPWLPLARVCELRAATSRNLFTLAVTCSIVRTLSFFSLRRLADIGVLPDLGC